MDAIHSLTRRAWSPSLNDEHLVGILPKCQQGWEENFRIEGASSIRERFSCQIISSISCEICKHADRSQGGNINLESSSILDLAIPPGGECQSLSQLLLNQFGTENIDDYRCEGCGLKGYSSKTYQLSCLPEYLFIQLDRFAGNQYLSKIVQFIEFPLRGLDLKPAVHPDLRGSMDMLYECIGTIEHIGATLESGHYKANVKYVDGDQDAGWIEYNDETLTKYGEEEIVVGIQILLMVSSLSLITMVLFRTRTPTSSCTKTTEHTRQLGRQQKIQNHRPSPRHGIRNSITPSEPSQSSMKLPFPRLASLKEKAIRGSEKSRWNSAAPINETW